ncbi:MAG: efflux RND transporter permease subunit [Peptostreptococcaceae bacterium]
MDKFADKILKHKSLVIIVFSLALVFSIIATPLVKVNYNMVEYLPEDSKSTASINLMEEEFDKKPPNLRIMLEDITLSTALEYKEKLKGVSGVEDISWIDDFTNIEQPINMIDESLLNSYYKDNNALIDVVVNDEENLIETIENVKKVIGDKGIISGEAPTLAFAQSSTNEEVTKIMAFLVPVIVIILMISTSSWFEPVLFLATVGISILINKGTNIFFGEISFITEATAAILQLAVSIDYAVFLLHRFADFRIDGMNVKEAMKKAMKKSFPSILASGLTTVLGFLALTLMRFKIGPDLGIVLAKGIALSLLSVMLLLPVLTIYTYKIIDKTQHRPFMPSFEKFSDISLKIGPVVVVIIMLVIGPSFIAQGKNSFTYGASSMSSSEETEIGRSTAKINDIFGKSNQLVFLLPVEKSSLEKEFGEGVLKIDNVSDVMSYSMTLGNEIPKEFLPKDQLSNLVSDKYSRMIITLDTEEEGAEAFKAIEDIRSLGDRYFGDNCYLAGATASAYDIKETVTSDNVITTLGAIIAIGLVIMLTYKSIAIPIILLIAIEASIWINFSYSYFSGADIAYIGYMVISAVQLGATVDYAILMANGYLDSRKIYDKRGAIKNTIKHSTKAVFTSATILAISGFALGVISTNEVIVQLGTLLGRGTVISAMSVLFFLPTMLVLCDKLIEKTTYKAEFYKGEISHEFVYEK